MKKCYRVIVQTSEKDRPYDFEMSAAILIAEYFKTDIISESGKILDITEIF